MGINGFDADLFDAVEFGDLDWIKQSLGSTGVDGQPIDIDAQNSRGETILMLASSYGYIEIVHFLLSHNSDPNRRDSQDETALVKAHIRNHVDVVKLLMEYGANS
jgi:ankyrin repeat protein